MRKSLDYRIRCTDIFTLKFATIDSRPLSKDGESSRKKIWIEDHLKSGAGAPGVRYIIAHAIREVDFFGPSGRCLFMAVAVESVGAFSFVQCAHASVHHHSGSGAD